MNTSYRTTEKMKQYVETKNFEKKKKRKKKNKNKNV